VAYQRLKLEMTCTRCKDSFLTAEPEEMRPVDSQQVSPQAAQLFLDRVTPHVGGEIYKAAPFSNDFDRLEGFIRAHRDHGLAVRSVAERT
jgi:hypothetical protein